MKTQYTDAILYHLKSDEPDKAMMEWLVQQPLIDQPDIFREFKTKKSERQKKLKSNKNKALSIFHDEEIGI